MVNSKLAHLLEEQRENVKEHPSLQHAISKVILLNTPRSKLQRRRIVVCCDGTMSDDSQESRKTNVALIHDAVRKTDRHGTQQLARYVSGCGTGGNVLTNANNARTGSEMQENLDSIYAHMSRLPNTT